MQLYTAFGYKGPGAAREIKDELAALLRAEGRTWQAVVREAVERDSWRAPPPPPPPAEPTVQLLVQEAEELKRLLDGLGERMDAGVGDAEPAVVSPPPTEV